eukprot:CAMPEP_0177650040 /NCGR_PEP_ID=MMETSP0447-20121125/11717_1 /TAXON_ID=0 /ORGANISM="Stygamoeba regulata, Strain BSH-02190019" /LENGTH=424 /DNA_ID=CAMNT_0019152857 /DNA_START=66 /DNA_END=1340 /DNA_ORIENTATION=+
MTAIALLLACVLLAPAVLSAPVTVVHQWNTVEFEFESAQQREHALSSGAWKPKNCAIAGVKLCGPALNCTTDRLFVTVPRWLTGVWATLNEVVVNADGASVLRPWPSLSAQSPDDCSKIQYVQSMEIDPSGVMWVLDVGRKYFAEPNPFSKDNSCPPKMVWIDIESGAVLDVYIFPDDVAPYAGSQLNDLVLDVANQVAYITDTAPPLLNSDKGGLIVFDHKQRASRRFEHASTHAQDPAYHPRIHGWGWPWNRLLSGSPVDGIALHPRGDRLFYTTNGGTNLYSLPARLLADFSVPLADVARQVQLHGAKPSNTDGMAFGSDGTLFFGGMETDTVYALTAPYNAASATPLATDHQALWWADTMAFDNKGYLWVTSNRIESFLFPPYRMSMKGWFSGKNGPNFHICKIYVGTNSYLLGNTPAEV